jgi:signal transduction histidine kinase
MVSPHTQYMAGVPLEVILRTEELKLRPPRRPNLKAVNKSLVTLAGILANSPEGILQKLVETALDLCHAHSSGISLLEEENGEKIFRWHGVAGQYAPHLGGTTPREFSPCGTVLDTDAVQLMCRLDRHFSYFAEVEPRIEEALLVPFHVRGKAVGTIWVISHDETRRFDAEDVRVMSALGEFAAGAYQTLYGTLALKGIIATIRDPLVVLDGDLRVKIASRSFYDIFHVTPDVTEGRLFFELGNGQWNIPALRTRLEDVLIKQQLLESYEVKLDFPSLGRRVMMLNARKLRGEGNPGLILLTMEDVTSRRRIEDELVRSYEDSQRFAHVAAHDLRAPLRSSITLLELLALRTEEKLEGADRHLLSMAKANLQRLQILMSDILAYTELGGTEHKADMTLQAPLQIALTNLEKDIEETRAHVTHGPLPSLRIDRSVMALVFQNIIGNALKFRGDAPLSVRVACEKDNEEWIISIADNGQGFDPEYAEQIFLPFKRLHGSDIPGSGIGLASCQRVVERWGGRIWAIGEPGKGATFCFTVPFTDPVN